MKNPIHTSLLFALFLILCGCTSIFGQAQLEIRVLDPQSNSIIQGEILIEGEMEIILNSAKISSRNPIIFKNLPAGKIQIQIESPGFELFKGNLKLAEGANSYIAKLEIRKIEAEVDVEQSAIDTRLDRAFSSILTQQEIDSLPDDPREIGEELRRRYGDDLIIRVNGFTGGMIPPKEMIRSIQINRSSFDAEYHELGKPNINIQTKAAIPKFIGMGMLRYGNSALNARNSFAREKTPSDNLSATGFLAGPITSKSSFYVSINKFSNSRGINTYTSDGGKITSIDANRETNNDALLGEFSYDINEGSTVRTVYEFTRYRTTNLGVGGFNLIERGYSSNDTSHENKTSLNGIFRKKISHSFRSKISYSNENTKSNSDERALIVAGAFSTGGSGIDNTRKKFRSEVFEMISLGFERHIIKAGGEFRFENIAYRSADDTNGTYFFSSIERFRNGSPSRFTQSIGKSEFNFNQYELAVFFQDDIRIRRRMQIGLGLRYEKQNQLHDTNNFSPRLSATYVLDKKARFVVRTGAGILYQWLDTSTISRIKENDGTTKDNRIIINPSYPNPGTGGVLQEVLPPSIFKQAENLRNPYIFVTQTALNMNLGSGLKFDVSYKFERGIRMLRSRDINAPIDGIRPNQNQGRVRMLESSGLFRRNSLEISGTGVLFERVRVTGRYKLSKAMDDFSGKFSLPMDNYNLHSDFGRSNLDRRHFLTTSFSYSPYADIRINPIFTLSSPRPFTITTGLDNNNDTVFNDRPIGIARNSTEGTWSKRVDLRINWTFPFLKKPDSMTEDGKRITLPKILAYHRLTLSASINNLFNFNNKRGFVGNQLSPFYLMPISSEPARSLTFGILFIYF